MKTIFYSFLFLGVQLVYFISDANEHEIVCDFGGATMLWSQNFQLDVNHFKTALKHCKVLIFGQYLFDRTINKTDTFMLDSDKNAIKSIIQTGTPVHVSIGYLNYKKWSELMAPSDQNRFNYLMDGLVKFLNEYQITGVVMQSNYIYNSNTPSTAQNVAAFITNLKNNLNSLEISMRVGGFDYAKFTDPTAFNYKLINDIIDGYFIDLTISNFCNSETKRSSINPIESSDKNLLTIKTQTIAVMQSAIDKTKVYAQLQVNVIESVVARPALNAEDVAYQSYSQLCSFKKKRDAKKWCSDYINTLYNQGHFASTYYSGIVLAVMEGDDFDDRCGCDPYPVSNAIISGWLSLTEPICSKIDGFMDL